MGLVRIGLWTCTGYEVVSVLRRNATVFPEGEAERADPSPTVCTSAGLIDRVGGIV
jgi:hypothetical protein